MKKLPATLLCLLLLNGCGVSGHYRGSGPCKGFHKDQQACLNAADNSAVIGRVKIGQSFEDVRKIMGKYPERREANEFSEEWSYLTSYSSSLLTVIVFKQGLVVEIKQISSHQ